MLLVSHLGLLYHHCICRGVQAQIEAQQGEPLQTQRVLQPEVEVAVTAAPEALGEQLLIILAPVQ
jgi:hypothetical protein